MGLRVTAILQTDNLTVRFEVGGGLFRQARHVQAVSGVSLSLHAGETLALVGESGSGKTTFARAMLGLAPISDGRVRFDGRDVTEMSPAARKAMRRSVQVVFQDPFGSLDPRLPVGAIIAEPLRVHGIGDARSRDARVADLLGLVGLSPDAAQRYPHQFSGGQRQRIAIARALAPAPRVIIADEPLSALDVSIQSQILNLMAELRERTGISYFLISHDLAAVHHLADRVAALYLGRVVELAPRDALYENPAHPYTRALLDSVPRIGTGKRVPGSALPGDIPSPMNPPPGCHFHPRCPRASRLCSEIAPPLSPVADGHLAACHHPIIEGGP
jgi:oligopeptide/dipeptide ABC transporter ATP-binding protein